MTGLIQHRGVRQGLYSNSNMTIISPNPKERVTVTKTRDGRKETIGNHAEARGEGRDLAAALALCARALHALGARQVHQIQLPVPYLHHQETTRGNIKKTK